jgi:hypothetical protein
MVERAFFDVSWMAVRGRLDAPLLAALDLSEAVEVPWARGLSAVLGDYWDADAADEASLSRVFVVDVPGREWCCLIGGWFGDTGEDARVVEACMQASRLRGEAYVFTTQGRMDWYAWMAASEGSLRKRFVWSGEPTIVEGVALPDERWSDADAFHEDAVCRLATHHAAGPDEYGEPLPAGLLATTTRGRAKGVIVARSG